MATNAPRRSEGVTATATTRDEDKHALKDLLFSQAFVENTELQDALTGRGTASCATEDAIFPAPFAAPSAATADRGRHGTADGPNPISLSSFHRPRQESRRPQAETACTPALRTPTALHTKACETNKTMNKWLHCSEHPARTGPSTGCCHCGDGPWQTEGQVPKKLGTPRNVYIRGQDKRQCMIQLS